MKPAFLEEKGLEFLEAERGAQLRVVAQSRVGVQRQMRTVNGQIAFDEQCQQLAAPARPRHGRRPEQAVMDDEQIGPGGRRQLEGGEGAVHRGGDLGDRAGVFHLQAVDRAVPVVKRCGTQASLAMRTMAAKLALGMKGSKQRTGEFSNARRKDFCNALLNSATVFL